ncbi:RNA polymerase subunit sigma [Lachnoclostridium sp. An169]|uniref:RNA polymerase sigma factor n=1 Tax=Lachnoclostridium sp. An169 TaxID=1965569 RepID=UPI000B3A8C57|nr:RNA polymerase sigma factor [Lachnoclostridium sp. An169]OUP84881.1 RNA polymerase subunit sigma [Lachnoclostridium sp. An169]
MDFEEIYRSCFRDVFLYLRGLARNKETAEEMAQETFLKAMRALDTFDGSKDIKAWLFTIARNTYYTYRRRQKIYVDEEPDENTADPRADFTEKLADEESAFRVHRFLHAMEEPYKEVFTLRVFGEMPFERIGLLFGKSAGWARVTFYRAKKQIQEYMAEEEPSGATERSMEKQKCRKEGDRS